MIEPLPIDNFFSSVVNFLFKHGISFPILVVFEAINSLHSNVRSHYLLRGTYCLILSAQRCVFCSLNIHDSGLFWKRELLDLFSTALLESASCRIRWRSSIHPFGNRNIKLCMDDCILFLVGFFPLYIIIALLQFTHLVSPIQVPLLFEVVIVIFCIVSNRYITHLRSTAVFHLCVFRVSCLVSNHRKLVKFIFFLIMIVCIVICGTIFLPPITLSRMSAGIFQNVNVLLGSHQRTKQLISSTRRMINNRFDCASCVIEVELDEAAIIHPLLEKLDSRLLYTARELPSKGRRIRIFLQAYTLPPIIWTQVIVSRSDRLYWCIYIVVGCINVSSSELHPLCSIQYPLMSPIVPRFRPDRASDTIRKHR
mmetsp:Transcript_21956/g.46330  ORF Transcript_21956/g.46330 Transcript_21956/m.46330 type:complete len:367 (-) Transcript_21956:815-1915(-)